MVITNVALVITNVALVLTNVALVMYIAYIIVKFQKSNYQSCIGNNQCLNDNNQFRIYKYQLLTHWLLPMQDWLLPNVFSARGNNQFSMPLLPMHGFTVQGCQISRPNYSYLIQKKLFFKSYSLLSFEYFGPTS